MLDGETATPAVLSFLRGSKVGQVVTLPPQGGERGAREEVEDEVEVEREEGVRSSGTSCRQPRKLTYATLEGTGDHRWAADRDQTGRGRESVIPVAKRVR